jgi:hypothetical protein
VFDSLLNYACRRRKPPLGLQRSFSYFRAIGAPNLLAVIHGAHATDRRFRTLALVRAMASACILLFILLDHTLPRGAIGDIERH